MAAGPLVQTTAPIGEPVSLEDAKSHLRIDHTDEDDQIEAWIVAARERAQDVTHRQFMTATWEESYDAFPGIFYVPLPPLQSVTSIIYTDTDGNSQTLASSKYTVDTASEPGRVSPAFGEVWPQTRDVMNAVVLKFKAGYGAASSVPEKFRQAIKMSVTHWYLNRESVIVGASVAELPEAVAALLGSDRILSGT